MVDLKVKIILIGNAGTGKTSFFRRIVHGQHYKDEQSTIGIDFQVHREHFDSHDIKYMIWDTAGQDKFQSLVRAYFRKTNY